MAYKNFCYSILLGRSLWKQHKKQVENYCYAFQVCIVMQKSLLWIWWIEGCKVLVGSHDIAGKILNECLCVWWGIAVWFEIDFFEIRWNSYRLNNIFFFIHNLFWTFFWLHYGNNQLKRIRHSSNSIFFFILILQKQNPSTWNDRCFKHKIPFDRIYFLNRFL